MKIPASTVEVHPARWDAMAFSARSQRHSPPLRHPDPLPLDAAESAPPVDSDPMPEPSDALEGGLDAVELELPQGADRPAGGSALKELESQAWRLQEDVRDAPQGSQRVMSNQLVSESQQDAQVERPVAPASRPPRAARRRASESA